MRIPTRQVKESSHTSHDDRLKTLTFSATLLTSAEWAMLLPLSYWICPAAWPSLRDLDRHVLYLCGERVVHRVAQRRHISPVALYADGLVKQFNTSFRSLSPFLSLLLGEKEVDPLWYGLASLGREQSLFFWDVQHCLGNLIKRCFVRL